MVVEGAAIPPALEYLPGLFVRRTPPEVEADVVDDGNAGRIAAETAAFFRERGVERVVLHVPAVDETAAEILEAALIRAELGVHRVGAAAPTSEEGLLLPETPEQGTIEELYAKARETKLPLDPGPRRTSWTLLAEPRWRAALTALAGRAYLQHLPLLLTVVGFRRQGVHPLAEMYAGNGLIERNRELLANVLP